tara:strand:+ start:113989 stop:115656 length:1668 start_codon:yes stop_codon:yes gene_type:complete
MLLELRVRDYAVVEDLTLDLGRGLNVLTGETGAGKSIVVGALALLLGERASASVVRKKANRATVEAVFDIEGLPLIQESLRGRGLQCEDGLLILRREVAAEGRNRAWVNGSPTTAGVVGELGKALVDLHGQHEHQTLLRTRDQQKLLDAFGGASTAASLVTSLYTKVQSLIAEIEGRQERMRDIESRGDFLRFQLAEIDDVDISPGEDEILESEAGRHEHSEELTRGSGTLHETLYASDDSVADRLAASLREVERLAAFDAALRPEVELLNEALQITADVGRRIGDYTSSVDHDPERLEEVRSRLDKLFRLKRKYGPELADVLETAQHIRAELEDLEDGDRDIDELKRQLKHTEGALGSAAIELSDLRCSAAQRLNNSVSELLPGLGLPGASFNACLRRHDKVSVAGAESVAFLVAMNRGFDLMPLSRVASGGELSRVMLAIKATLASVDRVPVLVFDEIDSGVGGVVASAVASNLEAVSTDHQVLVVTHLAQVASRARYHFKVSKAEGENLTTASIRTLSDEARVKEIARMLGGDPESEASQDHARELLQASNS